MSTMARADQVYFHVHAPIIREWSEQEPHHQKHSEDISCPSDGESPLRRTNSHKVGDTRGMSFLVSPVPRRPCPFTDGHFSLWGQLPKPISGLRNKNNLRLWVHIGPVGSHARTTRCRLSQCACLSRGATHTQILGTISHSRNTHSKLGDGKFGQHPKPLILQGNLCPVPLQDQLLIPHHTAGKY